MFTPAWKHRPQSHNQPLSIHPLVLCPRTFTGLVAMSSIAGRLNGPDRPAIESFSGLPQRVHLHPQGGYGPP